jgi:hypothetical protein
MKSVVAASADIEKSMVQYIRGGEWTPSSGNAKARNALGHRLFEEFRYLTGGFGPAQKKLREIIAKLLQAAANAPRGPAAPGGNAAAPPSGGDDYYEVG